MPRAVLTGLGLYVGTGCGRGVFATERALLPRAGGFLINSSHIATTTPITRQKTKYAPRSFRKANRIWRRKNFTAFGPWVFVLLLILVVGFGGKKFRDGINFC